MTPTAAMKAAKSAACQPKIGTGRNTEPPSRCRLRTVCYGEAPVEKLRLRRIRVEGAVKPILCCEACAEGSEAA